MHLAVVTLVTLTGGFMVLSSSGYDLGLLQRGGGRALPETAVQVQMLFFSFWMLALINFQVHDGVHFLRPKAIGSRIIYRNWATHTVAVLSLVLVAVIWGELTFRRFLTARLTDQEHALYLRGRISAPDVIPDGAVDQLMLLYYGIFAALLLLHLVAQLFNPVDFDQLLKHGPQRRRHRRR